MVLACGCWFVVPSTGPSCLPLLDVTAHTQIVANTSHTTLTQHFTYPIAAAKETIKELRYVFPLYDGVSVVGFKCTVGDRVTLDGVVKERQQARADYDAAAQRGETAGLLERSLAADDVFTTTLGNVHPGEDVKVEITFIGELQHDAEVDGLRFTLPTSISPRYGNDQVAGSNVATRTIAFTLDIEVPEGSSITAVRSPSHPIAVTIGTLSTAPTDEPSLSRASAALSLNAELEKDIIFNIVASNVGNPSAMVERHPNLASQALMVTLVPKFTLPPDANKPEIVFICDRSGSMYNSIDDLKSALRIFLKSLPVGIKFNICSFGSTFSFLWPKSKTYDAASLAEASAHVETFRSNFGGTEMYAPVKATFEQRYKDMNLEVFLLTDGEIWDQDSLFALVNEHASSGAIRVFTLGVGIGASSSLIEGVARAGRGFSQTTSHGEKMDKKVVRMLKGALFPHINDFSLEVHYDTPASGDDDFELVEKISDSLVIDSATPSNAVDSSCDGGGLVKDGRSTSPIKKVISLFQKDLKDDLKVDDNEKFKADKFEGLPKFDPPKFLQTPTQLPSLFPFNRTTAYVLINDSAVPQSLLLRGTSQHGPLELEIPVTQLKSEGTTLHQLAARREAKELEEGRGWLSFAKDTNPKGKLLKDLYEGRFADMVEREAIRLGTTYQVAGKWTSFVALQHKDHEVIEIDVAGPPDHAYGVDNISHHPPSGAMPRMAKGAVYGSSSIGSAQFRAAPVGASPMRCMSMGATASFSGASPPPPLAPSPAAVPPGTCFASFAAPPNVDVFSANAQLDHAVCKAAVSTPHRGDPSFELLAPSSEHQNPLQALTLLQSFLGSWSWSPKLERVLGVGPGSISNASFDSKAAANNGNNDILATACAIAFFRKRLAAEKDAWEMMVEKAQDWLAAEIGDAEALIAAVTSLF